MRMKKIIVSVTNDLATDQRVDRVCTTLHQWGYKVLLVGRLLPDSLPIERPYRCKRIKFLFHKNFSFYAEFNIRLFFFLLFSKSDILLANDLDTLPANYMAAKLKQSRLIFDSHEYFPETPEVYKRKFVKTIWLFIEKIFIYGIDKGYTVSNSIAEIYQQKYHLSLDVVRNVPFLNNSNLLFISKPATPFILYQGSINIGRGLDLAIQAMQFIPDAELVIAGSGPELPAIKNLTQQLGLGSKVKFLGKIPPDELKEITMKATVGISLEEPTGMSYKAALPNKLFDYIQAGIPVLVSNLIEMELLVKQYNIGLVAINRDPEYIARQLNTLMYDKILQEKWKENLAIASKDLCWEKESLKLRAIFS